MRYRKTVGGWKDIESDFYANDSLKWWFREWDLESLLEMLLYAKGEWSGDGSTHNISQNKQEFEEWDVL